MSFGSFLLIWCFGFYSIIFIKNDNGKGSTTIKKKGLRIDCEYNGHYVWPSFSHQFSNTKLQLIVPFHFRKRIIHRKSVVGFFFYLNKKCSKRFKQNIMAKLDFYFKLQRLIFWTSTLRINLHEIDQNSCFHRDVMHYYLWHKKN